jgi:hypothetical protein
MNKVTDVEETRYKKYGRRSTLQLQTFQLPTQLRQYGRRVKSSNGRQQNQIHANFSDKT